jgi:hypothetical protein
LADRPDLVSRHLLNTILTNFAISQTCMLHCTGLIRNERALLLMAPHNSGKSTSALRLVLNGYRLLSDSQVYVRAESEERHAGAGFSPRPAGGVELLGFPVGKIKLRRDMVGEFPALAPYLSTEEVRDETKFSVDLRRYDPALVHESAFRPRRIDLCFLTRSDDNRTRLTPATYAEALKASVENSIFYDAPGVWRKNLAQIEGLLGQARLYHLEVGVSPEGIVRALETLGGDGEG